MVGGARTVCGGGSAGHTRTSRPCPHVVYRHPKRPAGPRSRHLGDQNSLVLGPHLHPARSYDLARGLSRTELRSGMELRSIHFSHGRH